MKFLDELLIDLQVFAQELLREHLAMKLSWNICYTSLLEITLFHWSKMIFIIGDQPFLNMMSLKVKSFNIGPQLTIVEI